MRIVYKLFGTVAFLDRNIKDKVEGDSVHVLCNVSDGTRLFLYSSAEKKRRDYVFSGGVAVIPLSVFGSGEVGIFFENGDGTVAAGTRVTISEIGGNRYLVSCAFSAEEEVRRLMDALIYIEGLLTKALSVTETVLSVKNSVDALVRRAESGDIINF